MKHKSTAMLFLLLLCLTVGINFFANTSNNPNSSNKILGHGNPAALQNFYQQWVTSYEASGGSASLLRLNLAASKALSAETSKALGSLSLNLLDGSLSLQVRGLDAQQHYVAWLIDNIDGPGHTVLPESGDRFVELGTLVQQGDRAKLLTQVDRLALADFNIDRVAITLAGKNPAQGIVISGAPDFLIALYYADKPWAQGKVSQFESAAAPSSPFGFLLPKMAQANQQAADFNAVMGAEIAEGRRIFTTETFNGNGRTCATCHRLDNNHTIDPTYIAKLPPDDPLFVAETMPALKQGFENPQLMRQLGLILANVDNFDKPGVMRSVPHLLGLSKTITTELMLNPNGSKGEFALDEQDAHALGWSGDGSVGTGSLREFSIGAVAQHFTKSLARTPGTDFRFPTDAELNALEAYMLSLGRSEEINLSKMTFKSPIVQRGKVLFDVKENPRRDGKPVLGTSANCNGCHSNAGAISSSTGGNPTRDTGVEMMQDQPAVLLDPNIPMDGGIGVEDKLGFCSDNDPATKCSYGEGRFNTPSLIEAADTAPFFHNNSVNTIEEAVAFYNTPEFNNSPGHLTSSKVDRSVQISSSQVTAVALFLRTINALDNIHNSNVLAEQAIKLSGKEGREITQLAMADTEDAIQVLTEGQLLPYPEAVNKLKAAYKFESMAAFVRMPRMRNPLLRKAIALKLEADALMVARAK